MVEFDPVLVHEWLSRSAGRYPRKVALISQQQRWTYEALDRHTHHLAFAMRQMGLQRGDRVVILLDNTAETIISLYGALKAGGVFAILAGSMKGPKLRYVLANSGARFIIAHTSKAASVSGALEEDDRRHQIVWVGPRKAIPGRLAHASVSWDDIFATGMDQTKDPLSNYRLPRSIDIDLATLIYTSGSTGEPKGVMSTHHNMVSAARSIIQYIGNTEDDIILNVLPLSFDYGLYQVIMAFMFGGTVVLEKSFLFMHDLLERIGQERVTGFPIVPTIVAMLLKMEDLTKYDVSTLRYMTNTGAALPIEYIHKLRQLFPDVTMISMFGLTECKRVCYLPPEELHRRPDSVGMAMPNCEVRVIVETGEDVAPGQTGELVVRGSNVMQGYWNDQELTDKTYKPGRYRADQILYSGDYFRKDKEGYLYFLGRKDDMIKSKGERVSPKEIENIIHGLEGVLEVAVVGIPDEILGQAIAAFIVIAKTAQLTEKQIRRYCAERMESFMLPQYIQLVRELPKTPNGKVDKKQLALMEEMHDGDTMAGPRRRIETRLPQGKRRNYQPSAPDRR